MSRFLPAVVGARAMRKLGTRNDALEARLPDMVDRGLQRLYAYQHHDGGWGWWTQDASTARMTAYVVYGLATARNAGFPVDKRTLERGLAWLKRNEAVCREPFVLYARKAAGDEELGDISTVLQDATPSAEEAAWLVLAGKKEAASALPLEAPTAGGPEAIARTSLVIRALASIDPRSPSIPPLAAWLMAQRRGGAWISTLDTAHAVYALTEIAGTAEEPKVQVRVNGEVKAVKAGRVAVPSSCLKVGKNDVEVLREGGGPAWASAVLAWSSKLEQVPPERGALSVTRRFERARLVEGERTWELLETGSEVQVADELRMVLTVRSTGEALNEVMIEAPIAAGTEPCLGDADWGEWSAHQEARDDRVAVAAPHVDGNPREFFFRLRATLPGTYHVMPVVAFAMYDPDKRGTSGEMLLRVIDK